ncbi:MAG: hypothetical protein PHD41_04125, partial [Methanosarcinaceae archaeon]|nr:hypothetical protein [Methanosarcinaceae archaeon]
AGKHARVVVTGEGCQHGVQDGIVQVGLGDAGLEVVDDKGGGDKSKLQRSFLRKEATGLL